MPQVLATVRHTSMNKAQDAMNMWLEDVHVDSFRVCLREVKTFDGKHKDIEVVSVEPGSFAVFFFESPLVAEYG